MKPSNILLDTGTGPDGSDHVYLADFGLTKRLADEGGLGRRGHLMGTIDYVAPEQIAGDEVDGRADVYSLGCVLYECVVGEPPFRRDSDVAVVFAHLDADPPAASAQRAELPAALDAVIATALAKDPAQRFSSCGELARAALAVAVDEASRQLAAVAIRAAAGRSDLSDVETELAGRVVDLQVVRDGAALSDTHYIGAAPRRRRGCARSRGWRASTRPTPSTSSGGSGWSPSSSLVSSAPRSSASSARRAAASRRSSVPG